MPPGSTRWRSGFTASRSRPSGVAPSVVSRNSSPKSIASFRPATPRLAPSSGLPRPTPSSESFRDYANVFPGHNTSWLQRCGVTHVAMESTGVYWKPVYNVLEGRFELLVVNAQHIKAVPGRKTDQRDSEWIADLLQHGLLRGSFVPPRPTREMRDLTRYRVSLTEELNRVANRIQKVLEDANVKLASVATDVLGVSGRLMLEAMVSGQQDAEKLAGMSKG